MTQGASVEPFDQWLPKVSPHLEWDWEYLRLLRFYLKLLDDREIERLMVFMPPQFGKTEQFTIHHTAYYLEQNPDHNVILASYSQTQANKYSRRIRAIARGRVALSRDRRAVMEWETAHGGGLKAVGVNAGVTGNPAHAIIVDDPLKGRKEAESAGMRNSIWDWYNDELMTRLKPGGPVGMILTRWHQDDLPGRILNSKEANRYTILSMPAIAIRDEQPVYDDDGELVYAGRKKGESLNPKRYPVYRLRQFAERSERTWTSLYQQQPGNPKGTVWQRAWWRFWTVRPTVFEDMIMSVDPTFEGDEDSDYVVIQIWGKMQGRIYLLDQYRKKLTYAETLDAINMMAARWPLAFTKLIEKSANGYALLDMLNQNGVPGLVPVIARGSKTARARGVSVVIRAGTVNIPDPDMAGYGWVRDEFLDEASKFPTAENDDQVDAASQAIHWWFSDQIAMADNDLVEAIMSYNGE